MSLTDLMPLPTIQKPAPGLYLNQPEHDPVALPLVQMGHMEKVVEVAQNHPQVQQQVMQEIAAREIKAEQDAVPEVEDSHKSEGAKLRAAEERRERREKRQGKRNMPPAEAETPPTLESSPHDDNPWAGNIVNLKI